MDQKDTAGQPGARSGDKAERRVHIERDEAGRVRQRAELTGEVLDGELLQLDEAGRITLRAHFRAGVEDGEMEVCANGRPLLRQGMRRGKRRDEDRLPA